MALTPEQKEANKKLRSERDRAYHERRRAWSKAREAAVASLPMRQEDLNPKVAPAALSLAAWEAEAQSEAAFEASCAEEKAIREKIAELTESLKTVYNRHNRAELNNIRKDAFTALITARNVAEAAVDAQYPDVAKVSSAAEWGPKNGFNLASE